MRTLNIQNVIPLLAVTIIQPAIFAKGAEAFVIEVIRQTITDTATFGELTVNGKSLCKTLEPPPAQGSDMKGPIPSGSYTGHIRYDKNDRWRIELDNVPRFKGIQIHIGNVPRETSGCILVGMSRDDDKGRLLRSAEAYKALKNAFYGSNEPVATPDKPITINIVDAK